MTVMGSRVRPWVREGERLIGALIPTPAGDRPPPVPAPVPALPVLGLPTGVGAGALVVETARMDSSGRVSARHLLRALGWRTGHRVEIGVVDGVVVLGSSATGLHVVGSRGEVCVPVAVRRMCGIAPGSPVLLAASLSRGVLMVHPTAVVAKLLADWYARLGEGCDGG